MNSSIQMIYGNRKCRYFYITFNNTWRYCIRIYWNNDYWITNHYRIMDMDFIVISFVLFKRTLLNFSMVIVIVRKSITNKWCFHWNPSIGEISLNLRRWLSPSTIIKESCDSSCSHHLSKIIIRFQTTGN